VFWQQNGNSGGNKARRLLACLNQAAGHQKTGTFSTRIEAQNRTATTEADIIAGKASGIPDKTFGSVVCISLLKSALSK